MQYSLVVFRVMAYNLKSRQRLYIASNTQRPSTIGTTELLYHRSRLMLRITKSVAICLATLHRNCEELPLINHTTLQ